MAGFIVIPDATLVVKGRCAVECRRLFSVVQKKVIGYLQNAEFTKKEKLSLKTKLKYIHTIGDIAHNQGRF